MALLLSIKRQILHQQRPGADDGHIALEDVPKLRQLVKACRAKHFSKMRQAHLVGQQLAVFVPRVRHGAEFIHFEDLLVLSGALLAENDGAAQLCPHQNGHDQQHRRQHEEVGYNYRMSNVVAGVVRGQYPHLEEHIAQKKAVYERYREGLRDLPVTMNPIVAGTVPNYWLSALIIDEDAMCPQVRSDNEALYRPETGKSCPTEILEVLAKYNAEGRPIWKPMHMQPMYRLHECVGREGSLRCRTNAYIAGGVPDVGADIFQRGLCLPSDNKLTEEQVDGIIALIHACFA